MTVRIDTLVKNLCSTDKTFIIPVWIGDLTTSDSVSGFQLAVQWDVAHVRLESPYYLASSGTLAAQAKDRSPVAVDPDTTMGDLVISAGNVNGDLIVGSGKPLLYLVGRVTDPDTIDGLNGWILPSSFQAEGITEFTPMTYSAGFVHVLQDTSAAYTGSFSFGPADFDVHDLDTVSLIVQNVRDRRVSEIHVTLKADTSYYKVVGTVEAGTLSESVSWSEKSINFGSDTLGARYVSPADLTSDGTLLKVVLMRTTDSAFGQPIVISDFSVNPLSCLGKLMQTNGTVTAKKKEHVDTTSSVIEEGSARSGEEVRLVRVVPDVMNILSERFGIDEVSVFDRQGRLVETHSAGNAGNRSVTIRLGSELPSGVYFLAIRGEHDLVYKQFTLIK
jgi:hypothetical protein